MDHRIPRVGTTISVVLALLALATFLFLNDRFEGPDPAGFARGPKQLTATFENTKTLPTKQAVLYKGIAVGRVNRVEWDREARVGVVTFTIDDDFELYGDAVLRIGERSLLGDPYLNVVTRGSEWSDPLEAGDEVTATRPSVNFDEALDFLDAEGREHVRSLLRTVANGTAPAGNAERLNETVGGATRVVSELRELTRALSGQEEEIGRLVTSASTVLSEIGRREGAVRTIVGSGRRTLDALAAGAESLERATIELPRLLEAGRRSLGETRPLIAETRPLAAKLRGLAPDLTHALDPRRPASLRGIAAQLTAVIDGLPALRRRAETVLPEAEELLGDLAPLARATEVGARNLVPALDYLTPRAESIAGLYALISAATKGRDAEGHYLRVGYDLDPTELIDRPLPADCAPETQGTSPNSGYCDNAYPGPGDALDPQPFGPPYPRLVPCTPPPRDHPGAPCR